MPKLRLLLTSLLMALATAGSAMAAEKERVTIWDLKLGQPISAQPPVEEFMKFTCGENGVPGFRTIKGWSDFAMCTGDPSELHEVAFEYDDEMEYILRAKDLVNQLAHWVGTTELTFPVLVSGLFDDKGVLKGIRMVSDPRRDDRADSFMADLKGGREAYQLGAFMSGRLNLDVAADCMSLPAAADEAAIADDFMKRTCAKVDKAAHRRATLDTNNFLKNGRLQSGIRMEILQTD